MKDSLLFALIGSTLLAAYFGYWKNGPAGADAGEFRRTATTQSPVDPIELQLKSLDRNVAQTEAAVHRLTALPAEQVSGQRTLNVNPFRAAAPDQADDDRRNALQAVQSLQLQSIVCEGTVHSCTINNTPLSEGQQVANFTIEHITPTSVTLRRAAYRFQLTLN